MQSFPGDASTSGLLPRFVRIEEPPPSMPGWFRATLASAFVIGMTTVPIALVAVFVDSPLDTAASVLGPIGDVVAAATREAPAKR